MRRLLIVVVLLAVHDSAAGQLISRAFEFRHPSNVEGFVGQPSTVTVRFFFYIPVDQQRYLPVDAELARILSAPPDVTAPPGISIRSVDSVCKPATLTIDDGTSVIGATGGIIDTTIQLVPDDSAADADHALTIQYPLVNAVFTMIGARPPGRPQTTLSLHVWRSVAAKEAFLRAEAEQRAKERAAAEKVRRAEEERRRQQSAAAERAKREARIRLLLELRPYAAAVLLLALAALLYRGWLFPDLTVSLRRGGHVQQRLPRAAIPERKAEPGTITETIWARNRVWRRKRIKVETFVSDAHTGSDAHAVDLLISVGTSVPPGRYVARSSKGVVKVVVTPA